jgi:hypothetical protein
MLKYLFLYPAEALALAAALILLWRRRVSPWLAWAALVAAVVALAVRLLVFVPEGWDLMVFWRSGRALWEGGDPYVIAGLRTPPLNPPTALPFFAFFALVPYDTALAGWTALNVLGCVALVPLTRAALRAQEDAGRPLPPGAVAALAAAVVFSDASRFGLGAGQFAVFTALVVFGALWAQGRGRPVLAGVLLALGTVKAATVLPFLLLFLRKRDLAAWVALTAASLGLCLLATAPADLLPRCRECLQNIADLSRPGRVNDYALDNPVSNDILSLDHLYYRLGLRDRRGINWAQLATLGVLGAWLARQALARRLSRPAACSVAACNATLFLYHRHYDTVLLALPLTFAAGRAVAETARGRRPYVVSALALLAVMYLPRPFLESAQRFADSPGPASRLIQAVVLPLAAWLTLLAMFTLAAAERRPRPAPDEEPAAALRREDLQAVEV